MDFRLSGLLTGFLLFSLSFQPIFGQSGKQQKSGSGKQGIESAKLKVPGITLVTLPAEPAGATGEAMPVLIGKSEIYFRAEELPLFKADEGDEISFVWQQTDGDRLAKEAAAGGTVIVKYIVEPDGKVKLADISETPAEVPSALTEEILKGISQLHYAKSAIVKGKPVRYVKKRSFTFLPPEEITANKPNEQVGLADNSDLVFVSVEQMPEFKGGYTALNTFIAGQLRYPEKSMKEGLEGKVFAQFIVEKDGSVSDAKIIKGLAPEMDAEVLRVVNLLHFEKPGKQNGRAVRVRFTYPVAFSLSQKK